MGRRNREAGDKAVALLATCVVIVLGAVTCAGIALASNVDPVPALLGSAGCFVVIALVLRLLLAPARENHLALAWRWLARRKRVRVAYRARRAKAPQEAPAVPPTAESVRDLAGGINTWVPSGAHRRPPPAGSRPGSRPE